MKPKRLFVVYRECAVIRRQTIDGPDTNTYHWRWRLIALRNGQIVGGSQEAFDSKGNAMRAARREASLYSPGVAAVEVADAQ